MMKQCLIYGCEGSDDSLDQQVASQQVTNYLSRNEVATGLVGRPDNSMDYGAVAEAPRF